MNKKISKILLVFAVLAIAVLFWRSGISSYLNLSSIKENQENFQAYYRENQFKTIVIYLGIYIATTALSLPGATILTLLGGALFGLFSGTVIVSFASTTGATLAFLSSRFLFRDMIENKFKKQISTINTGIEKDGPFYLFSMRLIPVFPFFIINLSMGLTKMATRTFFFVSQLGMLLGTIVYVNAGVQLGQISNLSEIFSLKLFISFALLGLFPVAAKKIIENLKAKKVYAQFKKPEKFDYNMVVIGGGSAGLVTAYISAAVKAKVALIEKHKMGGDCLNTGCIPSKALIKSAWIAHQMRNAEHYGLTKTEPQI